MIKKWETISSNWCGNYRVFGLYTRKRKHPVTQRIGEFTQLEATDWVNIIPVTKDNEIVLVEQYRHGIDAISIEIPAGVMEYGEEPRLAAERECIEETGYVGENEAIFLGKVRPNPAFLNNYCYHFLWQNCELKYEQNLDDNEDIDVIVLPLSAIEQLIQEGKIDHSLIMSALYFYNKRMQK